jgi:hypothetical protein
LARCSVLGAALLALGCQASTATEAKMAAAPQEPLLVADGPLEVPPLPPIAPAAAGEERPLLGARHDLAYAGPPSDVCRCLAVRVEESADAPALHWAVAAPHIDSSSQWIVALSSQGVRCEGAPKGSPGASYQGYETSGNDVIVFVEALTEGRPLTSGGIIPKPAAGGSVFVEAVGSVYGKPLQGEQTRCKVPTPAIAAGSTPAPAAAEAKPVSGVDAPSSGVRFAQSLAVPSPDDAPSSGVRFAQSSAAPSGAAQSSEAASPAASSSAAPSRTAPARASASAGARPINDGCEDSKYWTDKQGIRRIKPQCM